ncbi:MAG: hypothetical protein IJ229_08585, partial [Clostridia bacterium]|nr:hypothetical protein [Clostridia bacterium]
LGEEIEELTEATLEALSEDSEDEAEPNGEESALGDEDSEDSEDDEEDFDDILDALEDWAEDDEEDVVPEIPDLTKLIVGNPNHTDGKFFTGLWGNATSDIDVRTLVHGYNLVQWDGDYGMFRTNKSVVSGEVVSDDAEGNRTYLLALYDDLYYSDGTRITAWDYAFSVLFMIAPQIAELGGQPAVNEHFVGYDEYVSGEALTLRGVRVLSDNLIEFTIRHESLPYFFEFYRLGYYPYPIHVIAPGCRVYDDGDGIYIGNEDPTVAGPIFTVELLQQTVMDPDTGYLTHPRVCSGPYILVEYDGELARFEINPWFKGDENGDVPTIPEIEYRLAVNETMIDELQENDFLLLNKVTRQDTILSGMQLVGRGYHNMTNYPRIGLSFITFVPDIPALQEKNVRKAMAYCLDRDEILPEYVGNFGAAGDGLFGLGQWMYQLAMHTLAYDPALEEDATPEEIREAEEILAALEEINLDSLEHYDLDIEEAIRLLEENGWVLNVQGEPDSRGLDEGRC